MTTHNYTQINDVMKLFQGTKTKRGVTKPVHNKQKRKARNAIAKASRRANRSK